MSDSSIARAARCTRLATVVVLALLLTGSPAAGGTVAWQAGARDLPEGIRRERSVMVPMRDGVRLSTDLYFPAEASGPFSTIMIRSPYGKTREYPYGGVVPLLVEAGYVVAYQDTRGRYESEGQYTVRLSDREDGYDAVTWLSAQPWSNQKVATFGCSYRGETQIVLAAERHPNHIAAFPMAPSAGYDPGGRPWTSFDGGAFELAQTAGWFVQNGSKVFYGPPSWVDRQEWFRSDASQLFRATPTRNTHRPSDVVPDSTDHRHREERGCPSDRLRGLRLEPTRLGVLGRRRR